VARTARRYFSSRARILIGEYAAFSRHMSEGPWQPFGRRAANSGRGIAPGDTRGRLVSRGRCLWLTGRVCGVGSRIACCCSWPNSRWGSDQDLYEGVAAQPWQEHMRSGSTLAVDFSGRTDFIRNSQFGAQRVKDGVVDAMRAQGLSRPSVDLKRPDLRLNARLNRGRLILSIDLSGGRACTAGGIGLIPVKPR
jgi:hypothetical protein